mgnify:CR=1 FL=1
MTADIRTLAIASDHRGHAVVDSIKEHLAATGLEVEIVGRPEDLEQPVDYPDAAGEVTNAILQGRVDAGILVCGSGIGMSMAANRFRGIRAALVADTNGAEISRRHNDANVLCMGASCLDLPEMYAILDTWLSTEFEGGRHETRIRKIDSQGTCGEPTGGETP